MGEEHGGKGINGTQEEAKGGKYRDEQGKSIRVRTKMLQ